MKCYSKTPAGSALLFAYHAKTLDQVKAANLVLHVNSCPECQSTCAAQAAIWDALEVWETPPVSIDFDRRLYQRIQETDSRSFANRVRDLFASCFARPALPLALVSGLFIAGFLVDVRVQSVPPAPAIPVGNSLHSAPSIDANQVKIALEDLQLLHELDQDEAGNASGKL